MLAFDLVNATFDRRRKSVQRIVASNTFYSKTYAKLFIGRIF